MGRPPSNGGPSFRFNPVEVGEMEAILQAHNYTVPSREILEALAQRFSNSAERAGKVEVSGKQVWNWFQNRRYALRARAARTSVPGQVNMPSVPRDDQSVVRNMPQAPQPQVSQPPPAPPNMVRSMPQVPQPLPAPSAQNASRNVSENMEFEAKSARDGAWYDVASFLSHRSLESRDPEAMVRFAGFGQEEDEWVNIRKHIRQRSLPCESSECVAVLPGDLILCFQEGKEQALYFDAHVLDAQRRRHDVRGCRCRFLVRYDHDQSEEIVPLRKICRRPETDHRLQQLHAMPINFTPQKTGTIDAQAVNTLKVDATDITIQKQLKQVERVNTSSTTTSATPTTPPLTTESKLLPSKASDAGNATAVANINSSAIVNAAATATSLPTATTESKLLPSKASATGNATAVANINSSAIVHAAATGTSLPTTTTESKLLPSKASAAGNATAVANINSSAMVHAAATGTSLPMTTTESKLLPSKASAAGNATAVANINSSAMVHAAATGTSLPTATTESTLLPSKASDAGNATAVANIESSAIVNAAATGTSLPTATTESELLPSKASDPGNAAAAANIDSSVTVNTAATATSLPTPEI